MEHLREIRRRYLHCGSSPLARRATGAVHREVGVARKSKGVCDHRRSVYRELEYTRGATDGRRSIWL